MLCAIPQDCLMISQGRKADAKSKNKFLTFLEGRKTAARHARVLQGCCKAAARHARYLFD